MPDKHILKQFQALPLRAKVMKSQLRIREWYNHFGGNVCVAFSGGKDSTVLAHLVRGLYPDIPLIFANTGLEYPEIQAFARKMGAEFIRPKMQFSEVISKFGYPIISKENAEAIYYARRIKNGSDEIIKRKFCDQKRSELNGSRQYAEKAQDAKKANYIYTKKKWLPLCREAQFQISHKCCFVMKKAPLKNYQKKSGLYPILGTLTEESKLREQAWIKHGCNAYDSEYKTSQPLSFWTEQDILRYIYDEGLEIASVYGDIVGVDKDGYEYEPYIACECNLKCTGCQRTGCVYCAFGLHLEKGETRFQRLARTHPRQYEYCLGGGQWVDNPHYDPMAPKMDGEWVNWNPKKIWVPSKEGLGMRKVFEDCNKIYGKDFIRYE